MVAQGRRRRKRHLFTHVRGAADLCAAGSRQFAQRQLAAFDPAVFPADLQRCLRLGQRYRNAYRKALAPGALAGDEDRRQQPLPLPRHALFHRPVEALPGSRAHAQGGQHGALDFRRSGVPVTPRVPEFRFDSPLPGSPVERLLVAATGLE